MLCTAVAAGVQWLLVHAQGQAFAQQSVLLGTGAAKPFWNGFQGRMLGFWVCFVLFFFKVIPMWL